MPHSREYWDSNMWVAYVLKDIDPHHRTCLPVFDDMHDGKITVVVSGLVIGEVVGVIRREAIRIASKRLGGGVPSPQAAEQAGDDAVSEFFRRLMRLYAEGHVEILQAPDGAEIHMDIAMRVIVRNRGRYEASRSRGLIYKRLGMLDAMHALTALGYGIRNFRTLDRMFGDLASDLEFASINFKIM